MAIGQTVVFCGVTAARLYGLPVPDGDQRIHLVSQASARLDNVKTHKYALRRAEITRHGTWRLISPERLFVELAAELERIDLIVIGDAMLRCGLSSSQKLSAFLGTCRRRGLSAARAAPALLSDRADSPPETRLRMLLIDAGLPAPSVNEPVDYPDLPGHMIACPDLSYPQQKVAIEYEGSHHQTDRKQYVHDIQRDQLMAAYGCTVIRVTKEHLFRHPDLIVTRIREALRGENAVVLEKPGRQTSTAA